MKNLIKSIALILFCVVAIEPAAAQVTYDYDKEADFTTYKTYSFGGWQENSEKLINDLDKKRIYDSFKAELDKRGMKYVAEDGDVVISFFLVVDAKTSTTAYTNYMGTGMGYGGRYGGYYRPGWGWGGGYSTTSYSEKDYKQGTFVMDVYDTTSKKLIWQGVSKSTIKENANKREKSIPKGAKKLMKKYPVDIIK